MASHLFLGEALADLLVEVVRRVGLVHEGERLRPRQRGALSLAVERRLAPHVEIGMLGSRGGIPGSQGGKEPRDGPGKRFPGSPRPIAMTTYRMLATSAVALLMAGCVVAQPVVVRRPPPPPPVRVEIAPVAPTPAHVWIPGHWGWHREHYVWVPGHWEVPASPGYVWVPGGWMPREGGYVWVEGHWRAR